MSKQDDVAVRYLSFPDPSPNEPKVGPLSRELERVETANREFVAAYCDLDHEKMMQCWLRSPHVRCVHPHWEVAVGYDDVAATWKEIFDDLSSADLQTEDAHLEVAGRVAWANLTAYLTLETSDGQVATATSVITNIFELEHGGWRLVCHHASTVAEAADDLLDDENPN